MANAHPGSAQVDVELTPFFDRYDSTDLEVLRMEVHQCFGTWTGSVCGDGTHKLPIAAAIRKAIGKTDGDDVVVHLEQRLS